MDRIETAQRLIALGFTYAVVIRKDVSVRCVGTIESVFRNYMDAETSCKDLCRMYMKIEPDAFEVIALEDIR